MDKRTILIADPDLDVARSLKRALKDQYEILPARDGSKALEQAVLRYPDLILFHRNCPLIGATQFLRILRTNPRTEEIPLIVLSDEPVVAGSMPGFLEGVLVKPLNLDEVRGHIAAVFRRRDAMQEVRQENGSVSGSLDHISMADLLQVFSMNRRSGQLQISANGRSAADIFVHEGRIEEAVVGTARGEKALYRMLGWRDGHFTFVPGRRAPTASLSASTDSLLMEGMRQSDELERIRGEVPPETATIERVVPVEDTPPGLHPTNAEILELVQFYPRVGDLVDRTRASDLETYLALRSLIGAGLMRVVTAAIDTKARRLLSQDEILELRGRLRRSGLPPTYVTAPKLGFVASTAPELKAIREALTRWGEFRGDAIESLDRTGFGACGVLSLDSGLVIDVYIVPPSEFMLPFVYALSAGTIAAVVVGTQSLKTMEATLALLENERRASLVFAKRPSDPNANPSKRRSTVEVADFGDEELRRAVQAALKGAATADMRGVSL